jgi:uncharacterized RDD family membrane protein YckC
VTTMPAPSPEMTVGRQGHYAGAVSRLVAFGADVGASWGLYTIGVALFDTFFHLVTRRTYSLTNHQILALVILVVWEFLYYTYQWGVSGRTIGMAVFGLQVVTVEGARITMRQAALRTLGLALCIATLGIGFLGIVYQRERRALDDLVAKTAVVYSWDARAARLRWMARAESPQHHALPPQPSPLDQPEEHTPAF